PLVEVAVGEDGVTLTITGEPGATATITAADGSPLGTVVLDGDGAGSILLDPLNAQDVTVTQTDVAGNVSDAAVVPVPDTLAPDAPLVEVAVGEDG
ncbi:Ig-like domain-containing protein, partial [Ochrobactrum sp. EDr1-4]|uniref:Ig-like domain-containing protein n=1 Tax=Ochrobactrum sp. EDr1-4 TaxID=3368622 RepID=UPI003B9E0CCB